MRNYVLFTLLSTIPLTSYSADHIYVATNKDTGNTIALFNSSGDQFKKVNEFKTGGLGTGDLEIPALKKDSTHPLANGDDPLISAYGITLTQDKNYLLTVNAGDASVSLMKVQADGSLQLANKVATSDKFPISIATHGSHVVVASVGLTNGEGSISAFQIKDGKLQAIENSRRDLKARPSTIAFSSNGDYLLLTELVTGKIKSYALQNNTLSAEPVSVVDSPREKDRFQAIPVGFDVKSTKSGDILAVSEARFLTPDFKLREEANKVPQSPKYSWQTGGISTYQLSKSGKLSLVSGDIKTGNAVEGGEIANCWVEFNSDHSLLWAANALSSSISLFEIDDQGKAHLKEQAVYKEPKQMEFLSDLKYSEASNTLYQLVGNQGKVLKLKNVDGKLTKVSTADGLPALGAYGLEVISD